MRKLLELNSFWTDHLKQVSLVLKTGATIPKDYDMAPITSPVPMEIFSETKDGTWDQIHFFACIYRLTGLQDC